MQNCNRSRHHITLVGAGRQTSIGFWEGVLGMPFNFEQPNPLQGERKPSLFRSGDGRLITVFQTDGEAGTTERKRRHADRFGLRPSPSAFRCRVVTFRQAVARLDELGIKHSGVKDRGFMDSIYFEDPLGCFIELALHRFEPPAGFSHADVLMEAHKIRVGRDYNIAEAHLADAIRRWSSGRARHCRRIGRAKSVLSKPKGGTDGKDCGQRA